MKFPNIATPMCAVCRRPVDGFERVLVDWSFFRFTAFCHGEREFVDIPDHWLDSFGNAIVTVGEAFAPKIEPVKSLTQPDGL